VNALVNRFAATGLLSSLLPRGSDLSLVGRLLEYEGYSARQGRYLPSLCSARPDNCLKGKVDEAETKLEMEG
jgi:hypothetical protein